MLLRVASLLTPDPGIAGSLTATTADLGAYGPLRYVYP
jgi:hypothetical protein